MTTSTRYDVTVAIIVHGEPKQIVRTIESIQKQVYTFGQITILCLDNGTSPKARQTIIEMSVWNIDLPFRSSISVAKNTATRVSSDEFIFFFDDHMYLEQGGIQAAMEVFVEKQDYAGVCGFYKSANDSDWNILRDIKRHTVYGKGNKFRDITLKEFTTFSTGIGIVRKSIFAALDFPENVFPPDFGGEDVPVLLTALNEDHRFAFTPKLGALHEHNVTFIQFLKKMEVEIRGRYSLFYWAMKNPTICVPYLHGFLNFPLIFFLTLLVALPLAGFGQYGYLALPLIFFLYELILSSRALFPKVRYRLRDRILSVCYIVSSDLLTPICGLQYIVSSNKRPFPRLTWRDGSALLRLFFRWEMAKFGFYRLFNYGPDIRSPKISSSEERVDHFSSKERKYALPKC